MPLSVPLLLSNDFLHFDLEWAAFLIPPDLHNTTSAHHLHSCVVSWQTWSSLLSTKPYPSRASPLWCQSSFGDNGGCFVEVLGISSLSEDLVEAQQRETYTKYAIERNWAVVIMDNMDISFSYLLFNILTRALHSSLCIHYWPSPPSSSPSSFRQKDHCLCQHNRQAFTLNLLLSFDTSKHSLFTSTRQSAPFPSPHPPIHVAISSTVQATYEIEHHESTRPETVIARSTPISFATHSLLLHCSPICLSLSASLFYIFFFFSFPMQCTIKQSAHFSPKKTQMAAHC